MPRKWALIRPRITGLNSKMAGKPSWSRENFDGALSENTYPLLPKHLMLCWCARLLQQMTIMYRQHCNNKYAFASANDTDVFLTLRREIFVNTVSDANSLNIKNKYLLEVQFDDVIALSAKDFSNGCNICAAKQGHRR